MPDDDRYGLAKSPLSVCPISFSWSAVRWTAGSTGLPNCAVQEQISWATFFMDAEKGSREEVVNWKCLNEMSDSKYKVCLTFLMTVWNDGIWDYWDSTKVTCSMRYNSLNEAVGMILDGPKVESTCFTYFLFTSYSLLMPALVARHKHPRVVKWVERRKMLKEQCPGFTPARVCRYLCVCVCVCVYMSGLNRCVRDV